MNTYAITGHDPTHRSKFIHSHPYHRVKKIMMRLNVRSITKANKIEKNKLITDSDGERMKKV